MSPDPRSIDDAVAALNAERVSCEARGLSERLIAIDKELVALRGSAGSEETPPEEP